VNVGPPLSANGPINGFTFELVAGHAEAGAAAGIADQIVAA